MKGEVLFLVIFLMIALSGCVTSKEEPHEPSVFADNASIKWHRGNLEQAFSLAKAKQQLVLLFWGVPWCPQTSELRTEVIANPNFGRLSEDIIPVYLDGDSEYAQTWGELFEISVYPSILILDHRKNEIMRISESLTFEEFRNVVRIAIQNPQPFHLVLDKALNGNATNDEWRILANFAWYGARGVDVHDPTFLAKRQRLADGVPDDLIGERALLSARLLESASSNQTLDSPIKDKIRAEAGRYINAMMVDESARFAARTTLINSHNKILKWAFGSDTRTRRLMSAKWTVATTRLRADKRLSISQRLWTWYPELQAAQDFSNAAGGMPHNLSRQIQAAVKEASEEAKTPLQRLSVISGAAILLRKTKQYNLAAEILLNEVNRSHSPFLFYSALANLEIERNHAVEALEYANLASKEAKGHATKLQWLVNDARLTVQWSNPINLDRLQDIITTYYNELFKSKDGFYGRSYRSTKQLSEIIKGLELDQTLRADLNRFASQCLQQKDVALARCRDHFATILSKPSSS